MQKIVILGIGNILFKDEGVGIYASKYLEENFTFSPNVEVIDGGTLGFKLMAYYQEYDKVIILDTVSIHDTPGSVYTLPADVLMGLGSYRQTAHEVEVVEMLEICSMLDKMAEVSVIGMVPKDIESVEIDLSNEVKAHFQTLIQEVIKELGKTEAAVSPKSEAVSLVSIIDHYANPKIEHRHQ